MNDEHQVIVAAIDSSSASELVLDIASATARSEGALHIVHVVEPPLGGVGPMLPLAQLIEEGRTTLARARSRVSGSFHGHVEAHLVVDLFARGVLRAAAESHADLIIIGSHGNDRFQPLELGPVSRTVVAHASCPVLVARPTEYPLNRSHEPRTPCVLAQ